MKGHAIEARLYAEDPVNDFLPVTGTVGEFEFPARDGLRIDSGVEAGSVISTFYDPLMAKVIAHAPSRDAAAALLASALRSAKIHGLTTNRALLVRALEHPEFRSAQTDTNFLVRNSPAELGAPLLDAFEEELAAAAAAIADQAEERSATDVLSTIPSGWRNSRSQPQRRSYQGSHGVHQIEYTLQPGGFRLDDGRKVEVAGAGPSLVDLVVDGSERRFEISRHGGDRYVDSTAGPARLTAQPRFQIAAVEEPAGSLHAQMPGKIVRVEVVRGQQIDEGQVLVVMEAMKMEHTLRAPHRGVVTEIRHAAGEQVETGDVLVVVEQN
jgi:propionyl-CoA carboxylase alpha chain